MRADQLDGIAGERPDVELRQWFVPLGDADVGEHLAQRIEALDERRDDLDEALPIFSEGKLGAAGDDELHPILILQRTDLLPFGIRLERTGIFTL